MPKNTGLGKGLDALFAESPILKDIQEKKDNQEVIKKVKIIEVEPNKKQARKVFNQEALEELANSIKRYGVIQPIIVTKKENFYEIIAGERRWRAAKKAGLKEIPCIIRDEDEQKNKEISLIENIQRENLNPIEKALGYKELIDNYNLKQQDLADTLGISRSNVTNTLRILNLDKRVLELAMQGKLSESHCRSLITIEDGEEQYKVALRIIEGGVSVKQLEKRIKGKKSAKKQQSYEAIYHEIEDSFQGFFGTKVKLNASKKNGKGKIIIEYNSNEDLERILDLVKKEESE